MPELNHRSGGDDAEGVRPSFLRCYEERISTQSIFGNLDQVIQRTDDFRGVDTFLRIFNNYLEIDGGRNLDFVLNDGAQSIPLF